MSEKLILEILDRLEDRYLNRLLDQITDGCAILNKDRQYIFWNKSAAALTGFEPEEILDKSCHGQLALFTDSGGKPLCEENCLGEQVLKDGQPRLLEVYLQHKNGFRLPVRLKIIPLVNGDGQSVGLAELFTDISPAVTIPLKMAELEKCSFLTLIPDFPIGFIWRCTLRTKSTSIKNMGCLLASFMLMLIILIRFRKDSVGSTQPNSFA